MATFDILDYPHPLKVTVCRDNRPHDFPLPYTTEDPAEMEMLRSHPGVIEDGKAVPRKPKDPEPETAQDEPEGPSADDDAPAPPDGSGLFPEPPRKGGDR